MCDHTDRNMRVQECYYCLLLVLPSAREITHGGGTPKAKQCGMTIFFVSLPTCGLRRGEPIWVHPARAVVTWKMENGTRFAHRVVVRDTKGIGNGKAGCKKQCTCHDAFHVCHYLVQLPIGQSRTVQCTSCPLFPVAPGLTGPPRYTRTCYAHSIAALVWRH